MSAVTTSSQKTQSFRHTECFYETYNEQLRTDFFGTHIRYNIAVRYNQVRSDQSRYKRGYVTK